MDEITGQGELRGRFKNLETAFESRLGFPLPKTPKEAPVEFVMPHSVAGNFIDAVLAQELDDPHLGKGQSRERSQFVGFLERDGSLKDSPTIIGTPKQTRDAQAELSRWFRPMAGKEMRALHYWHTHTPEYRGILSTSDAAKKIGETRKSIFYSVGAQDGITVVMQTLAAKVPLSTFKTGMEAYSKLVWFYDSSEALPNFSALAHFFESRGHVLYGWAKSSPKDTVRKAHERGEFLNGIPLNRIGDPLWLRRVREIFKPD